MEWPLVKFFLWALLLFILIRENKCCMEDERIGLLELKGFLKSNINNTNLLLSWVNEAKSECCNWEGVRCNATKGHVIELSLNNLWQNENFANDYVNAWLNVSLLHPFKELRILDLSSNSFRGWLGNEEPNRFTKLSKLTDLILRDNSFDKEVLKFLDAFPVLKYLDLYGNKMEGPLLGEELVNLSNLEVLILGENRLNGTLPFKDMASFSNLEILDLTLNYFTGSISPHIATLSSLKAISLEANGLNGTLNQELCSLKKLEELDLSSNYFEGILPPCLNNLTSLTLFDISYNQFSGIISSTSIANLTTLKFIDLSNNLFGGNWSPSLIASMTSLENIDLSNIPFEGLFPFSSFYNHSKLKVIQLMNHLNNKLDIEIENPSWDPLFQLQVLVLSNCNLNNPTGDFRKFLSGQHDLEVLFLSKMKLKGSFPSWLFKNNTGLQWLNLQGNSFMGPLHLPSNQSIDLTFLDVSNNSFDGLLQENIGKIIPKSMYLILSNNHFEGRLPSSIGDMSSLTILDLASNNFSGELPMEIIANCTLLRALSLSNNHFQGEIFSKHFNLSSLQILEILELSNNHFIGSFPVVPLKYLLYIDVSNNHMSGTIPEWMGGNQSLIFNQSFLFASVINLSSNFFEGQIPCGVREFAIIDLSQNLLSGLLPSCLNLQKVLHLLLHGNKLTGSLPKAILNSSYLLTLDIRDNDIFGNIPDEIDGLPNLKSLLLRGNNFSGLIPKKLCRLKMLNIIDLSKNSFSGTIPYCFMNIAFGKPVNQKFHYGGGTKIGFPAGLIPYKSLLNVDFVIEGSWIYFDTLVKIEIVTKYRSNLYMGRILDMISVLDLSSNRLTGEIPPELGQLSSIHGLNLSYNQLIGSIPRTFSNMTQIESLDLSHNSLNGKIPSTLMFLNFLEIFSVAYNNLSGELPDLKAQFGTFGKSSYEGNPFLCGPPLEKSCVKIDESTPLPQQTLEACDERWYQVDFQVFFITLSVYYIILMLGFFSIFYINPRWRKQCFNLVNDCMYRCYYFALDTLKGMCN